MIMMMLMRLKRNFVYSSFYPISFLLVIIVCIWNYTTSPTRPCCTVFRNDFFLVFCFIIGIIWACALAIYSVVLLYPVNVLSTFYAYIVFV